MSAFPDDPGHFVRWLAARQPMHSYGPDHFAPRHLYRDYLGSLLAPLLVDGRLCHVQAEAVAVRETADDLEIACRVGAPVRDDLVVVATGNEGASLPMEPWRFQGGSDHDNATIEANAPVVVIGTGLTMVDRVLSLLHGGHRGPISAVSRRGLVPQVHRPDPAVVTIAEQIPFGSGLSHLTAWMRQSALDASNGGDGWRGFIDSLRPQTQRLWQSLPLAERRRFLRHARVFWDVHRHRIAPAAGRRLDAAQASGQLRIIAARIVRFEGCESGVDVHLARRRSGERQVVHARAVFECRGRTPDITMSENPVLRALLQSGTARPDALGLGLAVTGDCAAIDASGNNSNCLYALGPVTSGSFWEIVAIPDIRQQARGSPNT